MCANLRASNYESEMMMSCGETSAYTRRGRTVSLRAAMELGGGFSPWSSQIPSTGVSRGSGDFVRVGADGSVSSIWLGELSPEAAGLGVLIPDATFFAVAFIRADTREASSAMLFLRWSASTRLISAHIESSNSYKKTHALGVFALVRRSLQNVCPK